MKGRYDISLYTCMKSAENKNLPSGYFPSIGHTLKISGKRESQLKNVLRQIGPWARLWGTYLFD